MTKAMTWVAAAAVVLGAVAGSGTALASGATRSSSFGYVCLRCWVLWSLCLLFFCPGVGENFCFEFFFARLTNLISSALMRALISF